MPGWRKRAARREEWRPVLEAKVKRWSVMSCEQLLSEVADQECYQVEFLGKRYNVEVQILENTRDYIHVCVDVDDGSMPASFRPVSESLFGKKEHPPAGG
jgi:hypothetical protein